MSRTALESRERPGPDALAAFLAEGSQARSEAGARFFAENAERLARLCLEMSERFAAGGRLLAVGASPAARTDARHVAVEFVHPVIVGKRALPAIALTGEGGPPARALALLAAPQDIVLAFGAGRDGGQARAAVELARAKGCLTIAFEPSGAEWELAPPSPDPAIAQELVETAYHILWELVHVFAEHRGSEGRAPEGGGDPTGFLYPFLAADAGPPTQQLLADVRSSILLKAREIGELRVQTLRENGPALLAAARALRESYEGGGRLLSLGNGGSATDAADIVADLRAPGDGLPARPAIDLAEDPSILTAIANDIGAEAVFSRQVIAHGREGDGLLAFSTSGGSANVLAALGEARRRGLVTVAMVGYDGGPVAARALADHVIVIRCTHIPRIQEAQASAYHLLRELIELVRA